MPTEQTPATPKPKRTAAKTAKTAVTAATPAPETAARPASAKANAAKPAAQPGAKPAPKKAAASQAPSTSEKRTRARPTDVAAPMIDPDYRRALIAEAAYLRAERRNFAPGYEVDDWLNAESEIDTRLTLGVVSPTK